ncbi:MAG: hypothetical protein H7Z40_24005 [Phycisphaerae bacterium]|nr:hypothetical protein [Gemmatimonadaceae bacterium]
MFLLGAFLTGGAVGYAATRTFSPSNVPVQLTPAEMRAEWKRQLALSPEQIEKFDALYNGRRTTFDSIRALYTPAVDSIRAIYQPAFDSLRIDNQQKVMRILDSTQQATYREMIEKDKKRADSVRKAGGQK